jgi:hypothetical protein
MRLTYNEKECFVIFTPNSGTEPRCFWGGSPYDGSLCDCCSLSDAWNFNTREAALRKIQQYPEYKGKVVRCKFHSSATIYMRNY